VESYGCGAVLEALLGGGDGGGCHTSDPVSGETRPVSLAPVHDIRVSVGRPLGGYRSYTGLGGDSSSDITSMGSTSSSSLAAATSFTPSVVMTPSPPSSHPSIGLSDGNTNLLSTTW
jgi:hypothetical protein